MQNKSQFVYDQNSLESDYSYSLKYLKYINKNLLILHDQSSLESIHDHLSSFFSHFNVDTKQFCIEISCYFMNQNYGSLKRLFLKFDISFMFAQCAWNEFAHIHTQFFSLNHLSWTVKICESKCAWSIW